VGQVSLPVLSRKGKYDNWNYNWVSFKNYSIFFNEDLFIKRFFFLFFMYGIINNKTFFFLFFKKTKIKDKKKRYETYNLYEFTLDNILNYFSLQAPTKFYISQIFVCRYANWVYVYVYIYSLSNRKVRQKKKKIFNSHLLHQTYLMAKYKYLTNFWAQNI